MVFTDAVPIPLWLAERPLSRCPAGMDATREKRLHGLYFSSFGKIDRGWLRIGSEEHGNVIFSNDEPIAANSFHLEGMFGTMCALYFAVLTIGTLKNSC